MVSGQPPPLLSDASSDSEGVSSFNGISVIGVLLIVLISLKQKRVGSNEPGR
jgi:hypothetical protein